MFNNKLRFYIISILLVKCNKNNNKSKQMEITNILLITLNLLINLNKFSVINKTSKNDKLTKIKNLIIA